eukprot:TRINITY_DN19165_c0_g1_i1.p1 TRINITY_DN19165_c0_g1~~TRINITY_DN19165_c0_g1_i1.p1  ORF type:complete len:767 (-),score=112.75 TRINITY_DN19165_c0_g1_i1:259-2559(-)
MTLNGELPLSARGPTSQAKVDMAAGTSRLLSARDGPPETLRKELALSAARAHGTHVPHFDIFGQQHYRLPLKDKGHLLNTEKVDEWSREPTHRTRTDLMQARRRAKYPDVSYDVDGDGFVSPTDYFLGKKFGLEGDHRMNGAERGRAVEALEKGMLDKYSFGHERAGASRSFSVHQKRGKIVTVDNTDELAEIWPQHWSSNKVPEHANRDDLKTHRKAEICNAMNKLKDEWDEHNPVFVPEPRHAQEFHVAEPPISRIAQRREAFRREARETAGLDPTVVPVNPRREGLDISLAHIEPEFSTRSEMMHARKVQLQDELDATRVRGEQDYIPMGARHTRLEAEEYAKRRPNDESMTMTRLRQKRRQELAESNMSKFLWQVKEHEQYSKQDAPWWMLQKDYNSDAPKSLLKELQEPAHRAQPTGKITETAVAQRNIDECVRTESTPLENPRSVLDERTIKLWSSEFVPSNTVSQAPRLFDGVKQAITMSTDVAPMYQFSSFEPIRKEGILKDKQRRQQAALDDDERAHAWRLGLYGDGAGLSTGSRQPVTADPRATSPATAPSEQNDSIAEHARCVGRRESEKPKSVADEEVKLAVQVLQAEDPSMTERLLRVSRGKGLRKTERPCPEAEVKSDASTPQGGAGSTAGASQVSASPSRVGRVQATLRGDQGTSETPSRSGKVQATPLGEHGIAETPSRSGKVQATPRGEQGISEATTRHSRGLHARVTPVNGVCSEPLKRQPWTPRVAVRASGFQWLERQTLPKVPREA